MKRAIFLLILLTLTWRSHAATGDITGVSINTNGWDVLVYVDGFSTASIFSNKMQRVTNHTIVNGIIEEVWVEKPGLSPGVKLTVTSPTLDGGTYERVSYATKQVRQPYPNESSMDVVVDGGIARIRVSLSHFIHPDDTVIADINGDAFFDSVAATGGTGLTVTNDVKSGLPYPKAIPTFTQKPMQRITTDHMLVSAVAFHHGANDGRPVKSVSFVATSGGLSVTGKVTRPIAYYGQETLGTRWAEYATWLPLTNFSNGAQVRVDAIFEAWYGDTNANFNTFLDEFTHPTPRPAAYTNLIDFDDSWGDYIAVWDAATGSDVNGRAVQTDDPTSIDSGLYYATPNTALLHCLRSNAYYSAHIYGREGSTNWGGSAATWETNWLSEAIVEAYPGDYLRISDRVTGESEFPGPIRFKNIHWGTIDNTRIVDNAPYVHFTDGCRIEGNSAANIAATSDRSVVWIQGCVITNHADFEGFGSEDVSYKHFGNQFDRYNESITMQVFIGNRTTSTNTTGIQLNTDNGGTFGNPWPQYIIVYNNDMRGLHGAGSSIGSLGGNYGLTNSAIVQNIFECVIRNAPLSAKAFNLNAGDYEELNILEWNNLQKGTRNQYYYQTTVSSEKNHMQTLNNQWDTPGWVTDTDLAVQDGALVGNWPVQWGTGHAGNAWPNPQETTTPHGAPEYQSFFSFHEPGLNESTNWCAFVAPKSWAGESEPVPGFGDYNNLSYSPMFFIPTVHALSHDIESAPRGSDDPPGAYASGNVKRGGMFF